MKSSEIKPIVIKHLKSIALGEFLCDVTLPNFNGNQLDLEAYIFDFIANIPNDVDLFEAYEAETKTYFPVSELYENFSSTDLQGAIVDFYNAIKSQFIELVLLQTS